MPFMRLGVNTHNEFCYFEFRWNFKQIWIKNIVIVGWNFNQLGLRGVGTTHFFFRYTVSSSDFRFKFLLTFDLSTSETSFKGSMHCSVLLLGLFTWLETLYHITFLGCLISFRLSNAGTLSKSSQSLTSLSDSKIAGDLLCIQYNFLPDSWVIIVKE